MAGDLPDCTARECQEKDLDLGIASEAVYDGLSLLLGQCTVKSQVADTCLLKTSFHQVETHSPTRKDHAGMKLVVGTVGASDMRKN